VRVVYNVIQRTGRGEKTYGNIVIASKDCGDGTCESEEEHCEYAEEGATEHVGAAAAPAGSGVVCEDACEGVLCLGNNETSGKNRRRKRKVKILLERHGIGGMNVNIKGNAPMRGCMISPESGPATNTMAMFDFVKPKDSKYGDACQPTSVPPYLYQRNETHHTTSQHSRISAHRGALL
jgi:hypothetical protein